MAAIDALADRGADTEACEPALMAGLCNYALSNLVPCCAPCNGIKSGLLTEAEMETLGPVLAGIWQARLAALPA